MEEQSKGNPGGPSTEGLYCGRANEWEIEISRPGGRMQDSMLSHALSMLGARGTRTHLLNQTLEALE
jgi:hypothetical protein